jgi:NADPH-dependent 2,4-dienoyl-CoA reductase/sulfur reductase-like enzyme
VTSVDLLIAGAGPAGMSAAIAARRRGLVVMVVDDQPGPGGQIWRSVENSGRRHDILGPSYVEGRGVAETFRASGVDYRPGAQLWQVEPGFKIFMSQGGKAQVVRAGAVILATGAQERPVPFPGWTLPGVLTVGAAQILLKNAGQIPSGPTWIAGSGPLPLLYATQLLRAGGRLAGYLDTTRRGSWKEAVRHLPGALRASGDLLKGVGWMAALRRSDTRVISGVREVVALGRGKVECVRYRLTGGAEREVEASTLLIHEGVIPNVHAAMSLGCATDWNEAQDCFVPVVDEWGETSIANLFVAGDGAGIAGAKAAQCRGELAALRVAARSFRLADQDTERDARPIRKRLGRELAARPFLDAMFRPRPEVFEPADDAIVCRCEEITAGQIRALALVGRPGPNQIKAATRTGMGPCQGRQCAYTVTRLLASAQGRTPSAVGFNRIRPPLKPVTLGELASLHEQNAPPWTEEDGS